MTAKGFIKSAAEKAHNALYMRGYSRLHPQDPTYNRQRKLWQRYGATTQEVDALFAIQGRRCAICGTTEHGSKGWQYDHKHGVKRLRGILCWSCNVGLGHFQDDHSFLARASEYVRDQSGDLECSL